MKRWYGGVLIASLFMLLVLRYGLMKDPTGESYVTSAFSNGTNPLQWVQLTLPSTTKRPGNSTQVISIDTIIFSLFAQRNFSSEEEVSLQTWNLLKHLIDQAQLLPNGVDAIREAGSAWNNLMASVEEERHGNVNESLNGGAREKQCPYFLNKVNATALESNGFKLRLPCGMTQGSSITIIGIPNGLLGNFKIDLTGEALPGEPDPPIILHYNVRLHGDKVTEDPVIVQNTWTVARDWGDEERCPSPTPEKNKKVDDLDQCNKIVGRNGTRVSSRDSKGSRRSAMVQEGYRNRRYFPFKQGYLSVATLRVGTEGIQTTVDGKHITSFAYRETLEPWLVSEVRISGDLQLISVVASGLPTSEDSEHAIDLELLKSAPLSPKRPPHLFIGVFSTANNFRRRMAVRRTWMQYAAVRSGVVAVRFFVGLHKNQLVNEELWSEAQTYGDIQLMPFVDYYNLITWKTLAICIFGTEVASANYVMKTDDDAFVRVDEVLASLKRTKMSHGLLYGLINSDSQPHRNPDSKWYISPEEWPEEKYPPWAHGPGYVVSQDIAKQVYRRYREGRLKIFKLEDVAMGIWIWEMKKEGLKVSYEKDEKIHNEGCTDGYTVAHYQGPREMLCLWQKLQDGNGPKCCGGDR
ncbi:beta-1,3-galactosyltransferase GALT1 [Mercurialis annua]|uniref:beta-1,3-galactosyltransferase GALT1 n=1 Tax=Mercurialis annua TaxID=3986 RepID=UPI0021604882|nr:beta-1,3-galactosyltransferase GALT1 [Mercurialis annua]XP_050237250.1 beta-1,3-galactosyltransferase GALT1 [Mercurialis annua]XP_050237251.1 beta-1,3-galactosyltransferase GALT1 [Mercurialis annua]XP_050237253.1 beta-1,3-galactosyltransferase GALT1 [Mercurialis annua]XP_050237254.1 beta-1,3-galactosyltransferase GALT1 [Mercurialis annua]